MQWKDSQVSHDSNPLKFDPALQSMLTPLNAVLKLTSSATLMLSCVFTESQIHLWHWHIGPCFQRRHWTDCICICLINDHATMYIFTTKTTVMFLFTVLTLPYLCFVITCKTLKGFQCLNYQAPVVIGVYRGQHYTQSAVCRVVSVCPPVDCCAPSQSRPPRAAVHSTTTLLSIYHWASWTGQH